jgi:hypothetical protein
MHVILEQAEILRASAYFLDYAAWRMGLSTEVGRLYARVRIVKTLATKLRPGMWCSIYLIISASAVYPLQRYNSYGYR